MKQLFDTAAAVWDHGPTSAAVLLGGLGFSALAAALATGPLGAAAVLLPLLMIGYSAAAYLRRTVDDRDALLARIIAHDQSRRIHDTLIALELARPLANPAWSAAVAPRPPTPPDKTPAA